jgi:hypothetical protein
MQKTQMSNLRIFPGSLCWVTSSYAGHSNTVSYTLAFINFPDSVCQNLLTDHIAESVLQIKSSVTFLSNEQFQHQISQNASVSFKFGILDCFRTT